MIARFREYFLTQYGWMVRIGVMSGLSSNLKKVCSLVTLALALWLSGLGCALCCATLVTKDCCAEYGTSTRWTALSQEESEPGCCFVDDQSSSHSPDDAISKRASLKRCALLPNDETSLALIPHTLIDDHAGSTLSEPILLQPVALEIKPVEVDTSPPRRVDTYLRCCVLLI